IIARLCCFCRFENEKNDPPVDSFEFKYIIPGQELPVLQGKLNREPEHRYFSITIMGDGIPLNLGSLGYEISLKVGEQIIKKFTKDDALLIQIGSKEETKV
ncbi:MAG TPA: hypothetical protein VIG33_06335, partial [Pseudobdellovibrionaceae bacterium]